MFGLNGLGNPVLLCSCVHVFVCSYLMESPNPMPIYECMQIILMKTGIKLPLLFTSLFVSLVFIRIIRINSYIGIGVKKFDPMKFLSIIIIFSFNTDSLSKAAPGGKSDGKAPPSGGVGGASARIDTTLADKYFNKAVQLFNNAQYDSSVFYLQKASIIYQNAKVWNKYVECYNWLGYNFYTIGEYNKAMDHLNIAVKIGLLKLGKKHLYIAESYTRIGAVYWIRQQNYKALDYNKKALQIRSEFYDGAHPDIGMCYVNIGLIYNDQGDYYTALEYFNKALLIFLKQIVNQHHPLIAACYNNLGVVYFNIENYVKALECHQKSLDIRLKQSGPNHPDLAASYNNLGDVYRILRNYDKALEYFHKAILLIENKIGRQHPYIALFYHNIGKVYADKKNDDKAMNNYEQALKIYINAYGQYHPDVAETYYETGDLFFIKNDYNTALSYHQKAIMSLVKNFADNNIFVNPVIPKNFTSKTEREQFIKKINSMPVLLDVLESKAEAFYEKWKMSP